MLKTQLIQLNISPTSFMRWIDKLSCVSVDLFMVFVEGVIINDGFYVVIDVCKTWSMAVSTPMLRCWEPHAGLCPPSVSLVNSHARPLTLV